jgi:hypothetical protein
MDNEGEDDLSLRCLKKCRYCGLLWGRTKQKCSGKYGCGSTLSGNAASSNDSSETSSTIYQQRDIRLRSVHDKVSVGNENDDKGSGDETFLHEKKPATTPKYKSEDEKDFVYEVVGVIPENPNTEDRITRVLDAIGKMAKLRGFVPEEEVKREWVNVTADLGAIMVMFKRIENEDKREEKSSNYENFRFVFPTGHEAMSCMKAILKLMMEMGYEHLGPGYGFWSPKQTVILFAGYDFRICTDFILEVYRPIMTDKLISAWWKTQPEDKYDAKALLAWVKEQSSTNVNFKCHALLLLELVNGYANLQKGARMNIFAQHAAGRKAILPIMGSLNHLDYFKAMLKDIERYQFLCPPSIQKFHRTHFTFSSKEGTNEGGDFLMEGSINSLKPLIDSNTLEGFQAATALVDTNYSFRDVVWENIGHRKVRSRSLERKPEKYERAILSCCEQTKSMNPFVVDSGKENVMFSLDGKSKLNETSRVDELLEKGQEDCRAFLESRAKPTRVPLAYQERREDGQFADDNDNTDSQCHDDLAFQEDSK